MISFSYQITSYSFDSILRYRYYIKILTNTINVFVNMLSRVCVMLERKYVFTFLTEENEHSLVAYIAGKAAAAC